MTPPSVRSLAAQVALQIGPRPSLAAVERILADIAPNLAPAGFAAVLDRLPARMQPALHRDADLLIAERGGAR